MFDVFVRCDSNKACILKNPYHSKLLHHGELLRVFHIAHDDVSVLDVFVVLADPRVVYVPQTVLPQVLHRNYSVYLGQLVALGPYPQRPHLVD